MSQRQRRRPKPVYWVEEKRDLLPHMVARLVLGTIELDGFVPVKHTDRALDLLQQAIESNHLWLARTGPRADDVHLRFDAAGSALLQHLMAVVRAGRWVKSPAAVSQLRGETW